MCNVSTVLDKHIIIILLFEKTTIFSIKTSFKIYGFLNMTNRTSIHEIDKNVK